MSQLYKYRILCVHKCSQMFQNVTLFFCDSTPFEGAFGTNVTFVTLDPPLHHLLKPFSPLSNLPGSPLTYPTFPALQLLLATALLWIPSLNSLMTDFYLTTYRSHQRRLQGVAGVGKSMPCWYYRKKEDLQLPAIPPWSRPPCHMDV